ncbi:MAG: SMP-30/gluconolactonase/LRE family protein [Paracoccaceae bacterium]|nr:SMP-30/gluconolactonase/LRE family protein [Paracoccaceae bacterium]
MSIPLKVRNIVGESLIWDDRRGLLLWVDIVARTIHCYAPEAEAYRSIRAPDLVTSIGLREDGRYVVGLRKAIAIWDGEETFAPLAEIEPDQPENRLNEGVVGPDGAFWVGTMQNNIAADGSPMDITEATGRLYRVTSDGGAACISDDRFGVTNTMVWTEDGRFITADTSANAIYSYRMDHAGRLTDRRIVLAGFERGLPDGSCSDVTGAIWNCRVVGGGCLLRFTPGGELLGTVDLPTSWPTSCVFGGKDLDTLFVTSARFTMSEAHLAAAPQEGALMALKTGLRGRACHRMA